jgi:hypothetical protein
VCVCVCVCVLLTYMTECPSWRGALRRTEIEGAGL